MRVGFFTQNVQKGGLDTFIACLLRNWSDDDELILFCNLSHPGLEDLRIQLIPKVKIVAYDFPISQDLHMHLNSSPVSIQLIARVAFWMFGFPYMIRQIRKLLQRYYCDRLMVINGGYPGGDACQAATVAWARLCDDRPRAWHNFHNLTLPYSLNPLRWLKEHWIDFQVARSAAGFVTVSQACLETLKNRPLLLRSSQKFIYNGIDPMKQDVINPIKSELGLPESAKLVLMLAVFEKRKGHAFLFDAMCKVVGRYENAWLLVCGSGSGEDLDRVNNLRNSSLCRDHILLLGHRKDIGNLLSQSDVLVIPSQSQESFGYTAVEAMSYGLPVVTTNIGGLPEVVKNGFTGIVVESDDVCGFADAVFDVLTNESRRQNMGSAGRAEAFSRFSATRMAQEYQLLLNDRAS